MSVLGIYLVLIGKPNIHSEILLILRHLVQLFVIDYF
jgi:hypothetical protein